MNKFKNIKLYKRKSSEFVAISVIKQKRKKIGEFLNSFSTSIDPKLVEPIKYSFKDPIYLEYLEYLLDNKDSLEILETYEDFQWRKSIRFMMFLPELKPTSLVTLSSIF